MVNFNHQYIDLSEITMRCYVESFISSSMKALLTAVTLERQRIYGLSSLMQKCKLKTMNILNVLVLIHLCFFSLELPGGLSLESEPDLQDFSEYSCWFNPYFGLYGFDSSSNLQLIQTFFVFFFEVCRKRFKENQQQLKYPSAAKFVCPLAKPRELKIRVFNFNFVFNRNGKVFMAESSLISF